MESIIHNSSGSKQKEFYIWSTQVQAVPADTRVAYAAQRESWNAVVADLTKPPRLRQAVHWLSCYVMLSRARS